MRPVLLLAVVAAAVAADADAWKASLQRAVQLHQDGDLRSAGVHYKEALLAHEPLRGSWPVLTNYGLAIQQDAPAEAAHVFRSVVGLVPDGADGYFNLGNALFEGSQHAEAEAAFEVAVALNPTDAEAQYLLGGVRLRMGSSRTDEAVAAIRTSLKLQPAEGKAWVSLGDAAATQERWAESAAAYARACELRPSHGGSWMGRGNAQEEVGALAEAEASWRAALRLMPGDDERSGVYLNLGQVRAPWDGVCACLPACQQCMRPAPPSYEHRLAPTPCSSDAASRRTDGREQARVRGCGARQPDQRRCVHGFG